MKLTWQSTNKTMNTRNYHAHKRIKTCIWKYRNGNRYVPGWRATMRLAKSEVSAQLKNNFKHVIGQNRNNHAWQLNQSVIKSHMSGSHQYPFILHGLISQIPLFWNYENDIHAYIKLREKKNTIWKLEMFEWKLDFWNLFENWSPE